MPSVLITGTNRGIGLEFAAQYAMDGWRIFAGCRKPATAARLNRLSAAFPGQVSIHLLDVREHSQIEGLARDLAAEPIDVLLNNAGVYADRQGRSQLVFGKLDYAAWGRSFQVNTMAPIKMAECFVEQVARSGQKKIVTLSSRMGSIADNTSGGAYLYRSSKAASNAAMKSLALDLRPRGIVAVTLHPGWVRTDMGGKEAELSAEESVKAMRAVIAGLRPQDSGAFLLHDSSPIPW